MKQRPGAATRPSTGVGAGVAAGAAGGAAAAFLQNRPSTGQRPSQPAAGQRPAPGQKPAPGQRPGAGERPGAGQRPAPGQRPGTGDRRPGAGSRPGKIADRDTLNRDRVKHRDEIRNHFHNHPSHLPAYGHGFWGRHPHAHWHLHNYRANWWRWATWGAVTGWVAGGWGQPAYYNYGDNCYYEGDTVYYDGEAVATTEEFAEQAQAIATNLPEVNADDVEWLPLGVFALTQDGESSGAEPTLFLQLAVSKEGILAGTIQNTATDKVESIEGMVDKESGRSAWTIVGKTTPIMEAGISNLTQDEVPALLHFADGQTQQWLMIRLEEPEGSQESQ